MEMRRGVKQHNEKGMKTADTVLYSIHNQGTAHLHSESIIDIHLTVHKKSERKIQPLSDLHCTPIDDFLW